MPRWYRAIPREFKYSLFASHQTPSLLCIDMKFDGELWRSLGAISVMRHLGEISLITDGILKMIALHQVLMTEKL